MKLLAACSMIGGIAFILFGFRAFVAGSIDTAIYLTLVAMYGMLTVMFCDRE